MTGPKKLPVWDTVVGGLRLLAADWRSLLAIVSLPVVLLVAADIWLARIWGSYLEGPVIEANPILGPVNADAALLVVVSGIAMALWHRVRLVGPGYLSVFGLLAAWRNILSLTMHWASLIVVFAGVELVVTGAIGTPVADFLNWLILERFDLTAWPTLSWFLFGLVSGAVFMLPVLYITGRLALMLWALPVGAPDGLDRAWAAGRGNGWRLAMAILVATLPVQIGASWAQAVFPDFESPLALFLQRDIPAFLELLVGLGVVAAAHQYLCGEVVAANP